METASLAGPSHGVESHEATVKQAPSANAIWERIRLRVEDRLRVVESYAHRLLDLGVDSQKRTAAGSAASSLASEMGRLELPGIARHHRRGRRRIA